MLWVNLLWLIANNVCWQLLVNFSRFSKSDEKTDEVGLCRFWKGKCLTFKILCSTFPFPLHILRIVYSSSVCHLAANFKILPFKINLNCLHIFIFSIYHIVAAIFMAVVFLYWQTLHIRITCWKHNNSSIIHSVIQIKPNL